MYRQTVFKERLFGIADFPLLLPFSILLFIKPTDGFENNLYTVVSFVHTTFEFEFTVIFY